MLGNEIPLFGSGILTRIMQDLERHPEMLAEHAHLNRFFETFIRRPDGSRTTRLTWAHIIMRLAASFPGGITSTTNTIKSLWMKWGNAAQVSYKDITQRQSRHGSAEQQNSTAELKKLIKDKILEASACQPVQLFR